MTSQKRMPGASDGSATDVSTSLLPSRSVDNDHNGQHLSKDNRKSGSKDYADTIAFQDAKNVLCNRLYEGTRLETLIRPQLYHLCNRTTNLTMLLHILYEMSAISDTQMEKIKSSGPDYNCLAALYLIVGQMNIGVEMVKAWERSENHHIITYLGKKTNDLKTSFSGSDNDRHRPLSMSLENNMSRPNKVTLFMHGCVVYSLFFICLWLLVFTITVGVNDRIRGFLLPSAKLSSPPPLESPAMSGDNLTIASQPPPLPVATPYTSKCPRLRGDKVNRRRSPTMLLFPIVCDSTNCKLPPAHEISEQKIQLTIKRVSGDNWLSFQPGKKASDQVTELILMGEFSRLEIEHFCSVFSNLRSFYSL